MVHDEKKGVRITLYKQPKIPAYIKLICSGLSGMGAISLIHPLDVCKNRMQLSAVGTKEKEFKNTFQVARIIYETDGLVGLYSGISASLFRQATYTTTKLGVYSILFDKVSVNGENPPLYLKIICGMVSGMTGAAVGTPADVALIRMASDGRLPIGERRDYNHVFNALFRIVNEEGVKTLWTGVVPSMGRAAISTSVQLASYSQVKQMLIESGYLKDNVLCYFCASFVSGFFTSVASLPPDIAKTRLQSMLFVDGKPEYKGAIDVLRRVVRNEGFFALWKGFTPYYNFTAPQTVFTLLLFEYLIGLYKKLVLKSRCRSLSL